MLLLKIKKLKAFTLVELIIVITILAILATLAFVSFQSYTKSSRDSTRLATIVNIQKWIDSFQVVSWTLPNPDNQFWTWQFAGVTLVNVWYVGNGIVTLAKVNKIPLDPLTQTPYIYGIDTTKTKYQIATVKEGLQANTNIIFSTTYAASPYKAEVIGNYKWLLKTSTAIYNIPSLISSNTGTYELTGSVNYVVDNGENLPYAVGTTNILNYQNPLQTLQLVSNNPSVTSITGITLPATASAWNTNSGTIVQALWYTQDVVWTNLYWDAYFTNSIPTGSDVIWCASNPACSPSGCTLTIGTPSSVNQTWVKWASNCGFTCNANYSGSNCEVYTPPAIWGVAASSWSENAYYAWIYTGWHGKTLWVAWTESLKAWKTIDTATSLATINSATDGRVNIAATKVIDPTLASHPAAKYCDDLVWAWYNDWYLPASAYWVNANLTNCSAQSWEMQYLYCKHRWTGNQSLLGFANYTWYRSSYEYWATFGSEQRFQLNYWDGSDGTFAGLTKSNPTYARCVRVAD